MSRLKVTRAPPASTAFENRRSSTLRRSRNWVYGAISGTAAVEVHSVRVPHAARFRPSDGAIRSLGTRQSASIGLPATVRNEPLNEMS